VILIITGNDRQQYGTHIGIMLDEVTFVHSTSPAVIAQPLRTYLARHKDILGFKVLRFKQNATTLARDAANEVRARTRITVPSH